MKKTAPRPTPPPQDLMLAAQSLVEGVGAGRHLALRTGDAEEFYDYKPYAPGDPVNRIDWRVVARRDAPFLRRHRHQAPLTIAIVVDASSSMGFRSLSGAAWPTKLESARILAAALAMIALRQGDRVALVSAGAAVSASPLLAGAQALAGIIEPLARLTPAGAGGVSAGVQAAIDAAPSADICIALTDALEPPDALAQAISTATTRARSPREMMLIQILSEDELRPPTSRATLLDPESTARAHIAGAHDASRAAAVMADHVEIVRSIMLHARGRYELHRTSESGVATLRRLLARAR